MKSRGVDHAKLVDAELEHKLHPFYLWADDAVYNQHHEKLMVIVLGHCLDPKKKEAGRPPECSFLLIFEIEISQVITNFHHHIKT